MNTEIHTAFTKSNLVLAGKCIVFTETGRNYGEGTRFVARPKSGHAGLMACLRKNTTPTRFFARIDAGETLSDILDGFGWVSPTIKKLLKRRGFAPNAAGLAAMRSCGRY